MRRSLHPVVAAAVLTVTISSAAPAGAQPRVEGDSILAWNSIAVDTLVAAGPAAVPGPVGPLYLAYVHRAVYDAVEDAVEDGRSISVPAAVAAAAYTVLSAHFPAQEANLRSAYDGAIAAIPADDARTRGIAVGVDSAEDLLEERAGDGLNGPPSDPAEPGPGVWEPADPAVPAAASWLGAVRPFVLDSPSQFRPAGPPALASDRWTRDYAEVKLLGSATSTERSEAQTEVALFWADPPAVQSQRALRGYAEQENLGALAAARLFAVVNTSATDALIACAESKFHFDFWRPIGAIPAAGTDGNPSTVPEAGWTSLVPTPNFPEYASNHSCASTAIATTLDGLDGAAPFRFTVTSFRGDPPTLAATHVFTSPDQMISEVANARVWGGLHYRFSTDAGTAIGRAVAAEVLAEERDD